VPSEAVRSVNLEQFNEVVALELRETVARTHVVVMRRSRRQGKAEPFIDLRGAIQVANRQHYVINGSSTHHRFALASFPSPGKKHYRFGAIDASSGVKSHADGLVGAGEVPQIFDGIAALEKIKTAASAPEQG